jgi:thiol-disulfide isomerase/thioredoxin
VKIILSLLISAAICTAETAAPAASPSTTSPKPEDALLAPGSPISTDAFSKLDWIQGSAPKTWEPGKVYLFEFWATWCGPCLAAIPHVNELHKKYAAKGLIVNGINIKEDGKEKVADFVKNKGDGMSYNVAYSGDNSPFLTEWYHPFGLRGIPTTLIVKDGKLILRSHPMKLTDEIIEAILAGGDAQEQAITRMSAGQVIPQKPTP